MLNALTSRHVEFPFGRLVRTKKMPGEGMRGFECCAKKWLTCLLGEVGYRGTTMKKPRDRITGGGAFEGVAFGMAGMNFSNFAILK